MLFRSIAAAVESGALKIKGIYRKRKNKIDKNNEKKKIEAEKELEIQEAIIEAIGKKEYLEIEHLSKSYSEALSQWKTSFWFSHVFAAIGFLVLVVAFVFYSDEGQIKSIMQIVSGIVINAVSVLFVRQSSSARNDMKSIIEKLSRDKQRTDSIAIAEKMDNEEERNRTLRELAILSMKKACEV